MAVRVMECIYKTGQIGSGCGDEMDAGHDNHKEEENSINSHGMEDEDSIHVVVVAVHLGDRVAGIGGQRRIRRDRGVERGVRGVRPPAGGGAVVGDVGRHVAARARCRGRERGRCARCEGDQAGGGRRGEGTEEAAGEGI